MSDPDTIPTTLRPGEPDKRPTPRLCASHHADVARSKPIEKPKAPRKMEVTNTELRLKRVLYMGCCIRDGLERERVNDGWIIGQLTVVKRGRYGRVAMGCACEGTVQVWKGTEEEQHQHRSSR